MPEQSKLMKQVKFACEEYPYECTGKGANMVCQCGCIETSFHKGKLQSVWTCEKEANEHCLTEQEDMRAEEEALKAANKCACDDTGCSCISNECCFYESNNGYFTAHDTCVAKEEDGENTDRRLDDLEIVTVEMTNPGDSATNYTYRYINFLLEDVDVAALSQQTTISSSYQVVQTNNYGSHFQERVSTGQTATYKIKSYINCGFYEAVYEMHAGRRYWPEIPITLRFVHYDVNTPAEVVDVEKQGLCSAPWSSVAVSVNGGWNFFIEGTAGVSTTLSTCQTTYTPAYTTSSGFSLYRLRVGNTNVSSKWSRLLFKIEADNPC